MKGEVSKMNPDEPSRTALMVARQRAAHQLLDHGSILDDPFAIRILGEDQKEVLQFAKANPLACIGRLFTTARSRVAEDALSAAVERGIRQIVILGAGLDTFAFRNPYDRLGVRIYEVDHPATQAWKRRRLSEAQLALPSWLDFVPVDFERDNLKEKLDAAGFERNSPGFFTWLGVVPYLTMDAIVSILECISSLQSAEVVFDYIEPPEAFSGELREIERRRSEQLEKNGERSVIRFEPAGIASLLGSHGFCEIADFSYQEIASRFGHAVQGLATGNAGVHVVHARHWPEIAQDYQYPRT
jgi:methyltransferase (TIGR00027 family)